MSTATDLSPVCDALSARARVDAEKMLTGARAAAELRIMEAQQTAAAILTGARDAGARDAQAETSAKGKLAHSAARSGELAAQRAVYEELRERVTTAVAAALATPAGQERLRRTIRDGLGPDAEITELPGGGVAGVADGRRAVLSAASLAERGLARRGARIRELWAS
jgi:hypothetical protein